MISSLYPPLHQLINPSPDSLTDPCRNQSSLLMLVLPPKYNAVLQGHYYRQSLLISTAVVIHAQSTELIIMTDAARTVMV